MRHTIYSKKKWYFSQTTLLFPIDLRILVSIVVTS